MHNYTIYNEKYLKVSFCVLMHPIGQNSDNGKVGKLVKLVILVP